MFNLQSRFLKNFQKNGMSKEIENNIDNSYKYMWAGNSEEWGVHVRYNIKCYPKYSITKHVYCICQCIYVQIFKANVCIALYLAAQTEKEPEKILKQQNQQQWQKFFISSNDSNNSISKQVASRNVLMLVSLMFYAFSFPRYYLFMPL